MYDDPYQLHDLGLDPLMMSAEEWLYVRLVDVPSSLKQNTKDDQDARPAFGPLHDGGVDVRIEIYGGSLMD